jgi:hypothetical protein
MTAYNMPDDDQEVTSGKQTPRRAFGSSGLLALVLSLSTFLGAQQVKSEIVGRWISVTPRGGTGSMWNFKPNGTLIMSEGTVVDMPYQINGDKLIVPPGTNWKDATPQSAWFRIDGDVLYLREQAETGEGMKFERVTKPKPGDPPIVGTWKLVVDVKPPPDIQRANGIFTFTRDGLCKERVPFVSVAGTYSPANSKSGTFTLTLEKKRQTFSYRIADSKLYLKWPGRKAENVYVRDSE